jgi:hypothetical protein
MYPPFTFTPLEMRAFRTVLSPVLCASVCFEDHACCLLTAPPAGYPAGAEDRLAAVARHKDASAASLHHNPIHGTNLIRQRALTVRDLTAVAGTECVSGEVASTVRFLILKSCDERKARCACVLCHVGQD